MALPWWELPTEEKKPDNAPSEITEIEDTLEKLTGLFWNLCLDEDKTQHSETSRAQEQLRVTCSADTFDPVQHKVTAIVEDLLELAEDKRPHLIDQEGDKCRSITPIRNIKLSKTPPTDDQTVVTEPMGHRKVSLERTALLRQLLLAESPDATRKRIKELLGLQEECQTPIYYLYLFIPYKHPNYTLMSHIDATHLAICLTTKPILKPWEVDWDITPCLHHPAINNALIWIQTKWGKQNNYCALCLLAQCQPENDLTHLCQALLQDGAGQWLSDHILMVPALIEGGDTDVLFWDLFDHLRSSTGVQSFYDLCGQHNPNTGWHKEIKATFCKFECDWMSRSQKYGKEPTAKWFLRHSADHMLYILIFHPHHYTALAIVETEPHLLDSYFDPYTSVWCIYLAEDPSALDTWY
jgi:hypothetical protein